MSPAGNRYRSFKEKKNQTKAFRTYLLRVIIVFILFSFFTSFIALATRISGESMSPAVNNGNIVIFFPFKNISLLIGTDFNNKLKRGDLVLSETEYSVESTIVERILDPLVRIFTLQRKSLIYDNSEYKGRAELLRVVGLPGDTIKIKDYTVYIKGKDEDFFLSEFELTNQDYDLNKPLLSAKWKDEYPFSSKLKEIYVGEDQFFLISDNRAILNDSRVFGPVHKDKITGKVFLKYWPLNEFTIY